MSISTRLTAVCLLFTLAPVVQAAVVYGTSAAAELSGSRSVTANTITVNNSDPDWNDAVLSWNIVDQLNGTFTYTYTFTGFDSPAISHFTLDLSDDAVSDPAAVTGAKYNGAGFGTIEFGDKDGITGAVKFDIGGDDGTLTYEFTSNRSPVYGDFLVKAGNDQTATNIGFGDQSLMTTTSYIARPNGVAVPEPSAFLYLGLFALATFGTRRLTKRRLAR